MIDLKLNKIQKEEILRYLGLPECQPGLRYLNRLISVYTRKVPWESVSRINKRYNTADPKDCPRWPEEFWRSAIGQGFSGTCFESSLAFYSLLVSLGFQGYLTVNDMGDTRACHAAMVILIRGQKYLVDNTIPIHSAVRIYPRRTSRRWTKFHTYSLAPEGGNRYQVRRSNHPQRVAYTLIDLPVSLACYQSVVENDYQDSGFFLKSVVIVKVIGDMVWRFFSDRHPYCLEGFNRSGRIQIPLIRGTESIALALRFNIPQKDIARALALIPA